MDGTASPFIAFESVCLDLGGRRIINDLDFVIEKGRFICGVRCSMSSRSTTDGVMTMALRMKAGVRMPST
jgi:hypothetical protein